MDIYIKLLDEGTLVYRPVPARKIDKTVYIVEGYDLYNPEDENWEFPQDTIVIVEKKYLGGELVLVAIKEK